MSVLKQMDDLVTRVNTFEKFKKELAMAFRQVAESIDTAPTPVVPAAAPAPRPPAAQPATTAATIPARRSMSLEQRAKMSRRAKRRWAKARAAGKTSL